MTAVNDGQAANRVVQSLTDALGDALATIDRVTALAERWSTNDEWAHSTGYEEGRDDQLDLCTRELQEALDG